MVRKTGITGDPWHTCARCARDVRISSLRLQHGLWLCPRCCDNLTDETRPRKIERVLSDGRTEPGDPWATKTTHDEFQDI